MDDIRDDFEEKVDEDETGIPEEDDLLLGLGDEEEEKVETDDDLLDKFGFHRSDEEALSDF